MKPPFLRSAYNYDVDAASNEAAISEFEPSLALQSELEATDINVILKRFGITGQLPTSVRAPQYGDFTGVNDYQSALAAIQSADDSFLELPAHVRERFNNNPQTFVEFCSDEANRAEAERIGLVMPKAEVVKEVVQEPAPVKDSA